MVVTKEIVWGGRPLSIEVGRWAKQATGSAVVRYGGTTVLCTVVAGAKPASDDDFFPLTVNYIEKFYAAGKIPGGFVKREGRPSERETLVSRLIDRPIRPLFHKNFRNETQVVCTVLSFDGTNESDIISIVGTSAALAVSGLPFLSTIAAVRIGYENGEFILNPPVGHTSELDLVMAASKDGILMVESGAKELSEGQMLAALKFGHEACQPVIDMIDSISRECAKSEWSIAEDNPLRAEAIQIIQKNYNDRIAEAYRGATKHDRNESLAKLKEAVISEITEDARFSSELVEQAFFDSCSLFVREKILSTGHRIDERGTKDIRPISIDVGVLPGVHGTAVFMRGETQVLAVTTLGTAQDEQVIDGLINEYSESFLLHYNFPPFSVGEIGRLGAPGRREIGHGRLAWRAVSPVLPPKQDFPYTVRVVSEVLSCNGSSSMATVCGASLSMMDAGVPIKSAVAGIAMGLILSDDRYEILSDIMGEEDHLGDMDFKVAGTREGITALQMDIKVTGVTFEIMEKALQQARDGRVFILDEMAKVLPTAREQLSQYAPKMVTFAVPRDKIREIIGSGGKVIRGIIEQTGAKVDIDDDGNIAVAAKNSEALNAAVQMINEIAFDPEVGAIYSATVVKITEFGAFVRYYGAREGLVHISEMSEERVEKVSDVMQEGDTISVKYLGMDNKGRAKLTMKFKR